MAKPRFTPRFTLRLSPSLREDLRCEAAAKGDDFADLIRNILAEHVTRRSAERAPDESRAANLKR